MLLRCPRATSSCGAWTAAAESSVRTAPPHERCLEQCPCRPRPCGALTTDNYFSFSFACERRHRQHLHAVDWTRKVWRRVTQARQWGRGKRWLRASQGAAAPSHEGGARDAFRHSSCWLEPTLDETLADRPSWRSRSAHCTNNRSIWRSVWMMMRLPRNNPRRVLFEEADGGGPLSTSTSLLLWHQ